MILMHCLRILWRNGISQVGYGEAEQIVTSLSYSLFKAVNRVSGHHRGQPTVLSSGARCPLKPEKRISVMLRCGTYYIKTASKPGLVQPLQVENYCDWGNYEF